MVFVADFYISEKKGQIMIVNSMTTAEVYRELERDRDNVVRWFDHQYEDTRRKALKAKDFPIYKWYDYTSVRKNRYLICHIIDGKRLDKNSGVMSVALRKEDEGYTAYMTWLVLKINRMVILPHVFKRYAQRMKVEKTGVELIKHMMEQQRGGLTLSDPKLAAKCVRYKGIDHKFMAIADGVLLGNLDENKTFVAHTFITYDMTCGLQEEKFTRAREGLLWYGDIKAREPQRERNLQLIKI